MARITTRPLSRRTWTGFPTSKRGSRAPEKRVPREAVRRPRRTTSSPAQPLRTELSPGTPSPGSQEGEFRRPDAMAVLDVLRCRPDAQGEGIGKAVIAEVERQMRARGSGRCGPRSTGEIPR